MAPNDVIYCRRVALLAEAERSGNVAEACRSFGVSRIRYYERKRRADHYGLDALMLTDRRRPQASAATPTHVVEELLTLAVSRPTLGARQFADTLCERGFVLSKSSVQRHLVAHGLSTRARRLAKTAAIAATTSGLLTEAAREESPFGFSLFNPAPGCLVGVHGFYIGNVKGVGKVYQLTAIDGVSRYAFVWIIAGVPTPRGRRIPSAGSAPLAPLRDERAAALSDNGPEWISNEFRGVLAAQGIDHVHPAAFVESQRHRASPPDNLQLVLATGLPPTQLPLGLATPGRGRRLALDLQLPSPQPRRLHARPDPR